MSFLLKENAKRLQEIWLHIFKLSQKLYLVILLLQEGLKRVDCMEKISLRNKHSNFQRPCLNFGIVLFNGAKKSVFEHHISQTREGKVDVPFFFLLVTFISIIST